MALSEFPRRPIPSQRTSVLTVLLALLGQLACGESKSQLRLSKSTMGADWPFTVDTITLRCVEGDRGRLHVVFDANGLTYALNGTARGSPQVRQGEWKDSDDVRRIDPEKAARRDIFDRPFTNLPTTLIDQGLALCDRSR